MSGTLVGSIIATIITVQPTTKNTASVSPADATAVVSWWRNRASADWPQTQSASHAANESPPSATSSGRRSGVRRVAWWRLSTVRRPSGRELEVALQRVVTFEVLHARNVVAAAVAPVVARFRCVDRRPGDRAEDGLGERRGLAGGADVRGHLGFDETAEGEPPVASLDREPDRDPLDGGDLPNESGEVGDGAAELPGEQLEQDVLLLVGRSIVDEDRGLPRFRLEDVLGDVGRDGDRQPADVDAFDRALLDTPGNRRVARLVVGVLADPARAEHVARADLEQPAFDVVRHGLASVGLRVVRSVERPNSVD